MSIKKCILSTKSIRESVNSLCRDGADAPTRNIYNTVEPRLAVCYADDVALLAPSPSGLRIMLKTCINFADQHNLSFNADKTQLIKFYKSPNPVSASPRFIFLGQTLPLSNSISHLGHILTYNLFDDDDICAISKDMCRKANCLLHTFSCCDPFVKTRLFSSFCLSLYGASLWRSSPQLRALEVSFNNILRKIWSLPRHSHTGIVHSCKT